MDSKILGRRQFRHVTILQDYHRFRHLENIVLWDTPELHLNAALEARLYDAISRIAPKNHYWIATHSLEFINSVPLESIFIIRQAGTSATIERATGEERQTRITMYREMGAQVGLQLVSSVVAFVSPKSLRPTLVLDLVRNYQLASRNERQWRFPEGKGHGRKTMVLS